MCGLTNIGALGRIDRKHRRDDVCLTSKAIFPDEMIQTHV
jgi:hypothetical protein